MQKLASRSGGNNHKGHPDGMTAALQNSAGFMHPMEGALWQEHCLLRTLIDNMPDFIYVKDVESRFVVANQAVAHIMGADTPEALLGKTDFDFYPHELAARYYADEQEVIRSGRPLLNWEEPIIDPAGNQRWLLTTKVPLRNSSGEVTGLVGIGRDITDRRQAEEEIQRRNQELAMLNRLITASAAEPEPAAMLETACRELALIFNVPQATAALLDERKTEAVIVAEYMTEGRSPGLHQTIRVADNPSFQYLLTHKAPLVIEDAQSVPHPWLADRQRLAPIQDLMRERGVASLLLLPLITNGEVIGSLELDAAEPRRFSADEVSLAWNVADQIAGELARAQLAQRQRLLDTAIEQAAESVIITDARGTIVYVNPAFEQITGYSRAEAIGQPIRMLAGEESAADCYRDLWMSISAGRVWHGRLRSRKKDGTIFTEEATISPVRDEGGAIVNYVSVHRDVTRELQLEEQYHQAQKMEAIGRLTAGIAHDFNNLLTAINGFAELAQLQLDPHEPGQELVSKIRDSGRRAADLIRQLMTFSRKGAIEPQVLNLNDVVSEMDTMLRRTIGEDIQLDSILASELWPVEVDPVQIEQVIVNLAVNARDAMPHGGRLTIETANVVLDEDYAASHLEIQPGEYVLLVVSDTGMGMSQEVQAHIFEPFFTTKEKGKGSGLGLATVYGIVKQNGGSIWVYSEEGAGTTFKIYLPRAREATPHGSYRPETHREIPPGCETVLVVEDQAEIRDLARVVLEQQGYTVLAAEDGPQALRLAAGYPGPIHLLLTDVVMPGMSGKVLAGQLAQSRPGIRTLFMSGYTDETIAHHGVLDPGFVLLQKPFSPLDLARKVRQVLCDNALALSSHLVNGG